MSSEQKDCNVIRRERDDFMLRVPPELSAMELPRGYVFVTDAHDPDGRLKAQYLTLSIWSPGQKVAAVTTTETPQAEAQPQKLVVESGSREVVLPEPKMTTAEAEQKMREIADNQIHPSLEIRRRLTEQREAVLAEAALESGLKGGAENWLPTHQAGKTNGSLATLEAIAQYINDYPNGEHTGFFQQLLKASLKLEKEDVLPQQSVTESEAENKLKEIADNQLSPDFLAVPDVMVSRSLESLRGIALGARLHQDHLHLSFVADLKESPLIPNSFGARVIDSISLFVAVDEAAPLTIPATAIFSGYASALTTNMDCRIVKLNVFSPRPGCSPERTLRVAVNAELRFPTGEEAVKHRGQLKPLLPLFDEAIRLATLDNRAMAIGVDVGQGTDSSVLRLSFHSRQEVDGNSLHSLDLALQSALKLPHHHIELHNVTLGIPEYLHDQLPKDAILFVDTRSGQLERVQFRNGSMISISGIDPLEEKLRKGQYEVLYDDAARVVELDAEGRTRKKCRVTLTATQDSRKFSGRVPISKFTLDLTINVDEAGYYKSHTFSCDNDAVIGQVDLEVVEFSIGPAGHQLLAEIVVFYRDPGLQVGGFSFHACDSIPTNAVKVSGKRQLFILDEAEPITDEMFEQASRLVEQPRYMEGYKKQVKHPVHGEVQIVADDFYRNSAPGLHSNEIPQPFLHVSASFHPDARFAKRNHGGHPAVLAYCDLSGLPFTLQVVGHYPFNDKGDWKCSSCGQSFGHMEHHICFGRNYTLHMMAYRPYIFKAEASGGEPLSRSQTERFHLNEYVQQWLRQKEVAAQCHSPNEVLIDGELIKLKEGGLIARGTQGDIAQLTSPADRTRRGNNRYKLENVELDFLDVSTYDSPNKQYKVAAVHTEPQSVRDEKKKRLEVNFRAKVKVNGLNSLTAELKKRVASMAERFAFDLSQSCSRIDYTQSDNARFKGLHGIVIAPDELEKRLAAFLLKESERDAQKAIKQATEQVQRSIDDYITSGNPPVETGQLQPSVSHSRSDKRGIVRSALETRRRDLEDVIFRGMKSAAEKGCTKQETAKECARRVIHCLSVDELTMPVMYGRRHLAGNVIWTGDLRTDPANPRAAARSHQQIVNELTRYIKLEPYTGVESEREDIYTGGTFAYHVVNELLRERLVTGQSYDALNQMRRQIIAKHFNLAVQHVLAASHPGYYSPSPYGNGPNTPNAGGPVGGSAAKAQPLFPKGTLNCSVDVEDSPAQGKIRVTIDSGRGKSFILELARSLRPLQMMQEAIYFCYQNDLMPDEEHAMLLGSLRVADAIQKEQEKEQGQRSVIEVYSEQSMIDLCVAASREVDAGLTKFWTNGRMRTVDNVAVENLLLKIRRKILDLQPAQFALKTEA